jgi:hypothetical protein
MNLLKFIAAAVVIGAVSHTPVGALSSSQTAEAVCENGKVVIAWTYTNNETEEAVEIVVKDTQNDRKLEPMMVAANKTVSGTMTTGTDSVEVSALDFNVTATSGTANFDTKSAVYQARSCETTAVDTTATTDLPNTGPLDGFLLYTGLTLATGAAWLTTRKELSDVLVHAD